MSKLKSIDDDETMAGVIRGMVDDGLSLRQALLAQGYSEGDVRHAAARWRKAPGFRAAIVVAADQALAELAPMLLHHAMKLALAAPSSFVQAEMTKWLLERAGLPPPPRPQDRQQSLQAGSLTLNILPPSASRLSAAGAPVLDHEALSSALLSTGEGGGG